MNAELGRQLENPPPDTQPQGPLVTVVAECPSGSAAEVLGRVREVLGPVVDPPSPWPAPDGWREILPRWFTDACSDDERVTTCVLDRWSLRACIWWFQPEQRRWLWWDAMAEGDQLQIRLVPTGAGSLLLGALEWLLKVAGARSAASA